MNVINKLTLRHMWLNKRRTLVTMIGIIISVAMITAVSTVGYSFMDYMAREAMINDGYFHVKFDNYYYGDNKKILEQFEVENHTIIKAVGDYVYSVDDQGSWLTSPYVYEENKKGYGHEMYKALRVVAVQDNFFETLSIKLLEGNYPQNDKEILLSSMLWDEYEGKKPGDKVIIGDSQYTISGIIENMDFESSDLELPNVITFPVYTKLDVESLKETDIVSGYFYAGGVLDDIEDRTDNMVSQLQASGVPQNEMLGDSDTWFCSGTDVSYNYGVLTYLGYSRYENVNNEMEILKLILVIIIMVGSISLIANGFIISISERSQYLGMLASVGATKKQKRSSVYFEGFIEGVIAIPLGILVGLGGIGVTFKLIEPVINGISGNDLGLNLIVNEKVIIWAVILSVITICLSAYIPGIRASKITPIDAVRQNKDVKISSRTIKTMNITKKIFGFEGDLALKNLKRNKKRYRVTVFSMFISLTLFLSVYSLVYYLRESYNVEQGIKGYDITFISFNEAQNDNSESVLDEKFEDVTDKLLASGYIDKFNRYSVMYLYNGDKEIVTSDDEFFCDRYLQFIDEAQLNRDYLFDYTAFFPMVVLQENDLRDYLADIDVDYNEFVSDENNVLLFDEISTVFYLGRNRYMYQGDVCNDELQVIDYQITKLDSVDDNEMYNGIKEGEKINLELKVHSSQKKLLGMDETEVYILITPQMAEKLSNHGLELYYDNCMAAKSDNADELEKMFDDEVQDMGDDGKRYDAVNWVAEVEMMENALLVVSIFVYGFIILMSLICVANIVNTISTSLALRRREFAMLKSVGMADKSFHKMIAYESGFYGIKALIFGLPVGTLIMLQIRTAIQDSMYVDLGIPWLAYIIAVIGVFIVISVTMIYSARKIKKENVIDALKNENA